MNFNTGNNVPSTDPRDLYDNAENLDKLVNGADPFYADRLGKLRESWAGMENSFTNAQEGRETAFTLSQNDKEGRFQAFLVSSGYVSKGDYAANVVLGERNEYVAVNAATTGTSPGLYRPNASATLPLTLTGTWQTDSANLVLLGDDVLRQELADSTSPESGAALIGRVLRTFKSVKTAAGANGELRTVAGKYDREQVFVQGYYDDSRQLGGGAYYWDAGSTAEDDGGTVIHPAGVVNGRWIMRERQIGPYDFGAKGDGIADDTDALRAACSCAYALKYPVWLGDGVFGVSASTVLGSGISIQGISPTKSIIKALDTYGGGGSILKWSVPDSAVTGVEARNFRVDCNGVAAHGFEMVRAYDANSVTNVAVLATGDAHSSFRFTGLADGGPVVIGQTLVCTLLFAGHKNNTATSPTIFMERLQEAVFIECKAWGSYGSSKAPASPWVLQDCRSVTLIQCSSVTSTGYGVRIIAGTKNSNGVNITGHLYENVDNLLETTGSGDYQVIGLSHTAPRMQTPIAGGFNIAAANSCRLEILSSAATIASASVACLIECVDATNVANASSSTTVLQRANAVGLAYTVQSTRGISVWNSDRTQELLRTSVPSSGAAGLLIAHNNGTATSLKQVIVGDPDSGGTGYRTLRIAN